MIYGIGVDVVEIARMQKSMQREHFVQRVFSKEEQEVLAALAPHRAAESASSCFAAKEAFLKATGKGLGGFDLADIGVLRKESGEPYFSLSGSALEYCNDNKLNTHISLTHDAGIATAFVVLEKE